jgi:glycosyltransferase involved in cell wall biosynthesis
MSSTRSTSAVLFMCNIRGPGDSFACDRHSGTLGQLTMKPRIGFVLEQALGHVAYGMSLREALSARDDIECEWLEVSFAEQGFERIPLLGRSYLFRGNFRARNAIARAHGRRPFDALFVHTSMIALLLAPDYMAKIPTVLSLDATPLNYDELASFYGHAIAARPVEHAKLMVHRAVMRRAHGITTWSQWAKDSVVRDYGVQSDRVTVVHPGTTLTKFPDRRARRERPPGPFRILFVGGDFVRKGGDLLLQVFRRHLRGFCELYLVTKADVPSGDGVHVYRNVTPHSPELLRLYADADVFALPTRADCFGVVLAEAMASSLPVVTTRVAAIPEAVADGVSGFVIDPGDGDALRDRLQRLANDPGLRVRMGENARRIGEESFDMRKNADRIANILTGVARGEGNN